jgi:hypothetical protein
MLPEYFLNQGIHRFLLALFSRLSVLKRTNAYQNIVAWAKKRRGHGVPIGLLDV